MRSAFILVFPFIVSWSGFAATPAPERHKFADVMEHLKLAPELLSVQNKVRSIEMDFTSRDLVLEPQLELGAKRFNEQRSSFSPIYKTRTNTLSALLTAPFSTGTTLTVTPTYERDHVPSLNPHERTNFDWEVTLSQSLWQDGFGRATRLRRSREDWERRQQLAEAMQTQAQVQVDFETLYWDWATAIREQELRAKNVTRGREILKWTRDRFRRSAAESSDVLQAQALLSQRELQLMAVQQNALRLASSAERFLPGFKWTPDPDELARPRDLNSLLSPWVEDVGPTAQKLELIEARAAAMAASGRADEARESIRPELALQLGYGKNAIDTDGDTAIRNSFGQSHEDSTIALVFKTGLGLGMERRHVESLRAQRDSAKQHLAALEADAAVAWEQQKRDVDDLLAQIERARKLTEVQWRKADAERRRYRVGRSTAFQAITFEQDAAEAEITLWNLYAQMRKTEARARLFAR